LYTDMKHTRSMFSVARSVAPRVRGAAPPPSAATTAASDAGVAATTATVAAAAAAASAMVLWSTSADASRSA